MAKITSDFDQAKELLIDFDRAVANFCSTIDSFFNEINSYNGWEGDAADKYLSTVNAESSKYVTFGENLNNYSNTLSEVVEKLETSFIAAAK